MNTQRQNIQQELEALGAEQLREWQGQQAARPRINPEKLRTLAHKARVEAEKAAEIRPLPARRYLDWRWAAAAVIMLLVAVAIWSLPVSNSVYALPTATLDDLDEATILAYVEANIEDFDWALIESTLSTAEEINLEPLHVLPDTAIESFLEEEDAWWEESY